MHEEMDEYELIPLGPIRRLEKRVERVESTSSSGLTKDIMEIVKTNQEVVNEIVKINSELIARVNSLAESVSFLTHKIDDLMTRLEIVEPEKAIEFGKESQDQGQDHKGLEERFDNMEKRINKLLLAKVAALKRPIKTTP